MSKKKMKKIFSMTLTGAFLSLPICLIPSIIDDVQKSMRNTVHDVAIDNFFASNVEKTPRNKGLPPLGVIPGFPGGPVFNYDGANGTVPNLDAEYQWTVGMLEDKFYINDQNGDLVPYLRPHIHVHGVNGWNSPFAFQNDLSATGVIPGRTTIDARYRVKELLDQGHDIPKQDIVFKWNLSSASNNEIFVDNQGNEIPINQIDFEMIHHIDPAATKRQKFLFKVKDVSPGASSDRVAVYETDAMMERHNNREAYDFKRVQGNEFGNNKNLKFTLKQGPTVWFNLWNGIVVDGSGVITESPRYDLSAIDPDMVNKAGDRMTKELSKYDPIALANIVPSDFTSNDETNQNSLLFIAKDVIDNFDEVTGEEMPMDYVDIQIHNLEASSDFLKPNDQSKTIIKWISDSKKPNVVGEAVTQAGHGIGFDLWSSCDVSNIVTNYTPGEHKAKIIINEIYNPGYDDNGTRKSTIKNIKAIATHKDGSTIESAPVPVPINTTGKWGAGTDQVELELDFGKLNGDWTIGLEYEYENPDTPGNSEWKDFNPKRKSYSETINVQFKPSWVDPSLGNQTGYFAKDNDDTFATADSIGFVMHQYIDGTSQFETKKVRIEELNGTSGTGNYSDEIIAKPNGTSDEFFINGLKENHTYDLVSDFQVQVQYGDGSWDKSLNVPYAYGTSSKPWTTAQRPIYGELNHTVDPNKDYFGIEVVVGFGNLGTKGEEVKKIRFFDRNSNKVIANAFGITEHDPQKSPTTYVLGDTSPNWDANNPYRLKPDTEYDIEIQAKVETKPGVDIWKPLIWKNPVNLQKAEFNFKTATPTPPAFSTLLWDFDENNSTPTEFVMNKSTWDIGEIGNGPTISGGASLGKVGAVALVVNSGAGGVEKDYWSKLYYINRNNSNDENNWDVDKNLFASDVIKEFKQPGGGGKVMPIFEGDDIQPMLYALPISSWTLSATPAEEEAFLENAIWNGDWVALPFESVDSIHIPYGSELASSPTIIESSNSVEINYKWRQGENNYEVTKFEMILTGGGERKVKSLSLADASPDDGLHDFNITFDKLKEDTDYDIEVIAENSKGAPVSQSSSANFGSFKTLKNFRLSNINVTEDYDSAVIDFELGIQGTTGTSADFAVTKLELINENQPLTPVWSEDDNGNPWVNGEKFQISLLGLEEDKEYNFIFKAYNQNGKEIFPADRNEMKVKFRTLKPKPVNDSDLHITLKQKTTDGFIFDIPDFKNGTGSQEVREIYIREVKGSGGNQTSNIITNNNPGSSDFVINDKLEITFTNTSHPNTSSSGGYFDELPNNPNHDLWTLEKASLELVIVYGNGTTTNERVINSSYTTSAFADGYIGANYKFDGVKTEEVEYIKPSSSSTGYYISYEKKIADGYTSARLFREERVVSSNNLVQSKEWGEDHWEFDYIHTFYDENTHNLRKRVEGRSEYDSNNNYNEWVEDYENQYSEYILNSTKVFVYNQALQNYNYYYVEFNTKNCAAGDEILIHYITDANETNEPEMEWFKNITNSEITNQGKMYTGTPMKYAGYTEKFKEKAPNNHGFYEQVARFDNFTGSFNDLWDVDSLVEFSYEEAPFGTAAERKVLYFDKNAGNNYVIEMSWYNKNDDKEYFKTDKLFGDFYKQDIEYFNQLEANKFRRFYGNFNGKVDYDNADILFYSLQYEEYSLNLTDADKTLRIMNGKNNIVLDKFIESYINIQTGAEMEIIIDHNTNELWLVGKVDYDSNNIPPHKWNSEIDKKLAGQKDFYAKFIDVKGNDANYEVMWYHTGDIEFFDNKTGNDVTVNDIEDMTSSVNDNPPSHDVTKERYEKNWINDFEVYVKDYASGGGVVINEEYILKDQNGDKLATINIDRNNTTNVIVVMKVKSNSLYFDELTFKHLDEAFSKDLIDSFNDKNYSYTIYKDNSLTDKKLEHFTGTISNKVVNYVVNFEDTKQNYETKDGKTLSIEKNKLYILHSKGELNIVFFAGHVLDQKRINTFNSKETTSGDEIDFERKSNDNGNTIYESSIGIKYVNPISNPNAEIYGIPLLGVTKLNANFVADIDLNNIQSYTSYITIQDGKANDIYREFGFEKGDEIIVEINEKNGHFEMKISPDNSGSNYSLIEVHAEFIKDVISIDELKIVEIENEEINPMIYYEKWDMSNNTIEFIDGFTKQDYDNRIFEKYQSLEFHNKGKILVQEEWTLGAGTNYAYTKKDYDKRIIENGTTTVAAGSYDKDKDWSIKYYRDPLYSVNADIKPYKEKWFDSNANDHYLADYDNNIVKNSGQIPDVENATAFTVYIYKNLAYDAKHQNIENTEITMYQEHNSNNVTIYAPGDSSIWNLKEILANKHDVRYEINGKLKSGDIFAGDLDAEIPILMSHDRKVIHNAITFGMDVNKFIIDDDTYEVIIKEKSNGEISFLNGTTIDDAQWNDKRKAFEFINPDPKQPGWSLFIRYDEYEWIETEQDRWGVQDFIKFKYDGSYIKSGNYDVFSIFEMFFYGGLTLFTIWLIGYSIWTAWRRRYMIIGEGLFTRVKDKIDFVFNLDHK